MFRRRVIYYSAMRYHTSRHLDCFCCDLQVFAVHVCIYTMPGTRASGDLNLTHVHTYLSIRNSAREQRAILERIQCDATRT